MVTITVDNLIPDVFREMPGLNSEVWHNKVVFNKGELYMVSAESGTGKTSLCNYIYGVRKDYSGTIMFDEVDVAKLSIKQWCEIRTRNIAYLPQELCLFPELTAMENVQLKNSLTRFKSEKEIVGMFDELGIPEKVNQVAGKLSIGQQQRVAIIRMLCQPCDFFMLDEPVSHLDGKNNSAVGEMVLREARAQGAGVICTSVGNDIKLPFDKLLRL